VEADFSAEWDEPPVLLGVAWVLLQEQWVAASDAQQEPLGVAWVLLQEQWEAWLHPQPVVRVVGCLVRGIGQRTLPVL